MSWDLHVADLTLMYFIKKPQGSCSQCLHMWAIKKEQPDHCYTWQRGLKWRITEQPPSSQPFFRPLQRVLSLNKHINQNHRADSKNPQFLLLQIGFTSDSTQKTCFFFSDLGCVWNSSSSATLDTGTVGGWYQCSEGTLLEYSLKWQSGKPKCPCSSDSSARSKAAACLCWRANSRSHSASVLPVVCFYGNNGLLSRSSVLFTTDHNSGLFHLISLSPLRLTWLPSLGSFSVLQPHSGWARSLMEVNVNAGPQACCTLHRSVKSSLETAGTSAFMQLQPSTG